jgi:tetratricopeptide (TPR) repeat protein
MRKRLVEPKKQSKRTVFVVLLKKLFSSILFLLCTVMPINSFADNFMADFTDAKNAYDAGEYETAVKRFSRLLAKQPDNEPLLLEIHKYLGVSYLFIKDKTNAEKQFLELLDKSPDFKLDPLVFPIDVIDFFTAIKRKNARRLQEFIKARTKIDEEKKKAAQKARLREIERLRQNVYIQKEVQKSLWLVALLPFGAGQFQNGHKTKGVVFLTGELLLTTSAIVTFALHENLKKESEKPFNSSSERKKFENYEKSTRIANQISLGALLVMSIVGIIDSAYHFEKTRVTWKKVKESEVPLKFRKKKSSTKNSHETKISPVLTTTMFGMSIKGKF